MRSLTIAALLCAGALHAQDCSLSFSTPRFRTQLDTGIIYGTAPRFDGGTDTLRLDLYKPIGDGQLERPLVVMVHGGGFTGGDRSDLDPLCVAFASAGYATATISYRLGFHAPPGLSEPWSYDEAEVVRTAYRGMQDTKGAIRFLKGRHLTDSTSLQNVLLMGFSAGGINALQAAYLRAAADKPTAAGAIAPVVRGADTWQRPDLGPVDGELAQNGMDASVLAVVSYFGGLIDTTLLRSSSDPALFMYHQSGDPVVGCGHERGLWGMPLGVSDNYPYLFGSCMIDQRAQHLGLTAPRYRFIEYAGNEHSVHDPYGMLAETLAFMRAQFCTSTSGVEEHTAADGLQVWPAPSDGRFQVTLPQGMPPGGRLTLMDMQGRTVLERSITGTTLQLEVPGAASGTYVLRYMRPDGRALQERIQVVR
ncbi:MAG: alpha/beta hydrolase [Flavobacteriales bacterium]